MKLIVTKLDKPNNIKLSLELDNRIVSSFYDSLNLDIKRLRDWIWSFISMGEYICIEDEELYNTLTELSKDDRLSYPKWQLVKAATEKEVVRQHIDAVDSLARAIEYVHYRNIDECPRLEGLRKLITAILEEPENWRELSMRQIKDNGKS